MNTIPDSDHDGTACALACRGRRIEFPRRPLIMGILNINEDSFSGDGTLDQGEAIKRAMTMIAQGADIIDVGAESARTNRQAISEEDEIGRLLPFIHAYATRVEKGEFQPWDSGQLHPPLLSINTWRPLVVEGVLSTQKVDLINDIGALPEVTNAKHCARHGAALLLMHSVGLPKVPHFEQRYPDIWEVLLDFFEQKIDAACSAGLPEDAIVLDPGIDFAKQRDDNLAIFRHLDRLAQFGKPVLLPVSRKTVIGEVLGLENPSARDAGTMACIAAGMKRGAQVFRVHNVAAAAASVKLMSRLQP